MSLLSWLFGGSVDPETKEGVLAYMLKEYRLQAVQDSVGERYNMALTKYGGGSAPLDDTALANILQAAQEQAEAYRDLRRRHGELSPVPDQAGRCYFLWEATYAALEEWATAMVAAYEGMKAGATPHAERIQALQNSERKAEHDARKEELKLLKSVRLSAEEARRLFQEAGTQPG